MINTQTWQQWYSCSLLHQCVQEEPYTACTHGNLNRDTNTQTHILRRTEVSLLTWVIEIWATWCICVFLVCFIFREHCADVVTLCFISLVMSSFLWEHIFFSLCFLHFLYFISVFDTDNSLYFIKTLSDRSSFWPHRWLLRIFPWLYLDQPEQYLLCAGKCVGCSLDRLDVLLCSESVEHCKMWLFLHWLDSVVILLDRNISMRQPYHKSDVSLCVMRVTDLTNVVVFKSAFSTRLQKSLVRGYFSFFLLERIGHLVCFSCMLNQKKGGQL